MSRPDETVIGILYPTQSADDDYPRIASMLDTPVEVKVVHTFVNKDAHRVDALRDMGEIRHLLEAASTLKPQGIAAAMWACTSGSFVFGLTGAQEQVQAIQEYLDVPVSSTSLAFVAAIEALTVERVCIAATYPDDVAAMFAEFITASGVRVERTRGLGIMTGVEVGTLDRDDVIRLLLSSNHSRAEAILVPDTALHTVAWLSDFEEAVGKIVLTANQVTMWYALRLAERARPQAGLGALFAGRGKLSERHHHSDLANGEVL